MIQITNKLLRLIKALIFFGFLAGSILTILIITQSDIISNMYWEGDSIQFSTTPIDNAYPFIALSLFSKFVLGFKIFGTLTLALLIVETLIQVIHSIELQSTFSHENYFRIKRLAVYVLSLGLIDLFILNEILGKWKVSFSIDFYPFIGALLLFILAEVFNEGIQLKEENDLTV